MVICLRYSPALPPTTYQKKIKRMPGFHFSKKEEILMLKNQGENRKVQSCEIA